MKASVITSVFSLATLALANPAPLPGFPSLQIGVDCIPRNLATEWLQRFIAVIGQQRSDVGDAKTTANLILADGFQERSNGILLLEGRSLNGDGIAEYSKESFIGNLFQYPPYAGINTIKVLLDCDQLVWHCKSAAVPRRLESCRLISFQTTTPASAPNSTQFEASLLGSCRGPTRGRCRFKLSTCRSSSTALHGLSTLGLPPTIRTARRSLPCHTLCQGRIEGDHRPKRCCKYRAMEIFSRDVCRVYSLVELYETVALVQPVSWFTK